MYMNKRAQIRLNLASPLKENARSADRAFAPNGTNNTANFLFPFLFVKRLTPMIRASVIIPPWLFLYQQSSSSPGKGDSNFAGSSTKVND